MQPGVRKALADYLDSGIRSKYTEYLGFSWCRFFCGIPENLMGHSDLSDGTWVWPEGLSHYVREHNVLLPEDFVEHALGRRHFLRRIIRRAIYPVTVLPSLILGGDRYWREWCAIRRSDRFLTSLREARIAADEQAKKEPDRLVSELIAEHGLGVEECIWAGCDQRVLAGTAICARHMATQNQSDLLESSQRRHYVITKDFMTRCFGPQSECEA